MFRGLIGSYNKQIMAEIKNCDLVICRCPSIMAYRAFDYAEQLEKKILTESMGCAWDAYWNHGLLGKLIAPYMFLKMRNVVKKADFASYVTDDFLQKRYPRKKNSLSASNVLIKETDKNILQNRIELINKWNQKNIAIMTTAAVDVKYKGQQFMIRAIPEIIKAGINVNYYVIGEGDQTYLKKLAKKLNVEKQVVFLGKLPLDNVFEYIDKCHVYIQPSLQEGLPRSVIEAMSRGCICIGARIAGIPELLDDKYVIRRKNVKDISELIINICRYDKNELIRVSRRNYEKSKDYLSDVLDNKRTTYYERIKKKMQVK